MIGVDGAAVSAECARMRGVARDGRARCRNIAQRQRSFGGRRLRFGTRPLRSSPGSMFASSSLVSLQLLTLFTRMQTQIKAFPSILVVYNGRVWTWNGDRSYDKLVEFGLGG
jgi:hypothetical protein